MSNINQDAFDNNKYLISMFEQIKNRKKEFSGRLYMEVGGKLFDDMHAKRVLPGFKSDNKIRLIEDMKDDIEVIIVISNDSIENQKIRADKGITYEEETIDLIDNFHNRGIKLSSVVLNRYVSSIRTDAFIKKLEQKGINVYLQGNISGYPHDIEYVVSENGFGQNEYIPVVKDIIVVTAPGPGSGKMTTCLSQLYHEGKMGLNSGFAKIETFPVAQFQVDHPVNLAYEAATADLDDKILVDPYHLVEYGVVSTSYNRDIDMFPLLNTILKKIFGNSKYKSPTDMDINEVYKCVKDEDKIKQSSNDEIIRRYLRSAYSYIYEDTEKTEVFKILEIMNKAGLQKIDSDVVKAALETKEKTGRETVALKLKDGRIILGKEGSELKASAACLLNALKVDTGIDEEVHMIPRESLTPILQLKKRHLKSKIEKLDAWDSMITATILKNKDDVVDLALSNIDIIKDTRAHSTYVFSDSDKELFRNLGVDLTFEVNI